MVIIVVVNTLISRWSDGAGPTLLLELAYRESPLEHRPG